MKVFFLFVLFFICFIPLQAEDTILSLRDFILMLERNCLSFRENILNLGKATAAYKEGRAVLYPGINYSAPLNYMYNPQNLLFSVSNTEVRNLNADSLVISPEITLNQYLPTSGTLGVALKNTFAMNRMGEITPKEYANIAAQQYSFSDEPLYTNTANLTISYTQPLSLENGYQAGLTLIESSYAIAKKNFLITRNLIIYNAVKSYSTLKYLNLALILAESGFKLAENNYQEMKQNADLGRATQIMVLKTQAALLKAEIEVATARDAYNLAFQQFCSTFGMDKGSKISDDHDIIRLPEITENRDQIISVVLKNNIELQTANKQSEINRANITKIKLEGAPVLALGSNWKFDTSENMITDPGTAFTSPFGPQGNSVFSFSIAVTGKLFDADTNKQKIRQAEQDFQRAELVVEQKKTDLYNQIDKLLSTFINAGKNLEYENLNNKIAEMEYNNGKRDLELGQIAKLEFQTINKNLDKSRLSLIQAQNDRFLVQLEIFMLMGADLWEYF